MTKTSPEIFALRKDIENDLKRRIKTPADFEFLAGVIWERIHENISPTTLKRLWGYIDGADTTRRSTLCLLSRFLGFQDWENYLSQLANRSEEESRIFSAEGINTKDLKQGEMLEVTWQPNRRCVFRFEGGNRFTVVSNANSKLREGDTFDAACFLVGQPMYLDNFVRGINEPVSYVAGSRSGIVSVKVL